MKNLMNKRIISVLTIILVLIASCATITFLVKESPEDKAVKTTLTRFYDAYRVSVDGSVAENMYPPSDAANLVMYRHWYGNIQKYKIMSIKDMDEDLKQAEIRVTTIQDPEGTMFYMDTVVLQHIKDRWLIVKYDSTSREAWPKLP